jgi:hypothetical protein
VDRGSQSGPTVAAQLWNPNRYLTPLSPPDRWDPTVRAFSNLRRFPPHRRLRVWSPSPLQSRSLSVPFDTASRQKIALSSLSFSPSFLATESPQGVQAPLPISAITASKTIEFQWALTPLTPSFAPELLTSPRGPHWHDPMLSCALERVARHRLDLTVQRHHFGERLEEK